MPTSVFTDKTLLITGGTGSFGNAVLKRFLDTDIAEIRVLSRDEKKQDDMRRKYSDPKLRFYLGDVRDTGSVRTAMRGTDYVFNAAALKQVPSCEFFPMEAVRTNVIGTQNVIQEAVDAGVTRVVCLSTDKAVYPINAMGISKALMEKVMIANARVLDGTNSVVCGTRYGNVMASRGSVIPLFVNQVMNGQPLTITDPLMTRFMMTLDDAVDLVLYAFANGGNGDLFVQKAPAASIETLALAIKDLLGRPDHPVRVIGTRHGEKRYEVLCSREEMAEAEDCGEYFRIRPDMRGLNYERYFDEGEERITESDDYNSMNTQQLDVDGMKKLLLELPFINDIVDGRVPELIE
jgi:UDP-glucose 4-epimerase